MTGRDEPEGIFSDWTWDGRRLTIERDRYGLIPVYMWHGNGQIALSPSIERLLELGAPTDLDELAIAIFLRRGSFHGDTTPFAAIRTLPAARRIVWSEGRLDIEPRVKAPPVTTLSRDDAVEAFATLFRRAVARLTPVGRLVLPLSGGRDSRHILLELMRAGRPPDEVVTARGVSNPTDGDDVGTAAALARRFGLRHVVVGRPSQLLKAELQKNRDTGFCALEHVWAANLARYVNAHADSVYDGIGGDILSASQYDKQSRQDLLNRGAFKKLARSFLRLGPPGTVHPYVESRLFRRNAPWRALAEAATEAVAQELMGHADAANPIKSFLFWSRTRRTAALVPYALYGANVTVYSPFLDTEVFDLLMSLPPAMTLDRSFHDAAIHRACPEAGDIPLACMGVGTVAGSSGFARRYAFDVFRRNLFPPAATGIRRSWLLPRLAPTMLDGKAERMTWLAAGSTIYLSQLLGVAGHREGGRSPARTLPG